MRKFETRIRMRAILTQVGVVVGALALLLGAPAAVAAQGAQPPAQQQAPQGAAPTEAPSDADLQAFAEAYIQISEIRDEMMERMDAAETEEAQRKLQTEAGERMNKAITDAGLDYQTYREINVMVQDDEEVRQEVNSLLQGMDQ